MKAPRSLKWDRGAFFVTGRDMANDLSANARRELVALAQVRGPQRAEALLISHQRRDVGSCLCGWSELGKSHAGHQAAVLREAGLLVREEPDSTP
jgi:hypothetical protein